LLYTTQDDIRATNLAIQNLRKSLSTRARGRPSYQVSRTLVSTITLLGVSFRCSGYSCCAGSICTRGLLLDKTRRQSQLRRIEDSAFCPVLTCARALIEMVFWISQLRVLKYSDNVPISAPTPNVSDSRSHACTKIESLESILCVIDEGRYMKKAIAFGSYTTYPAR
jgi:hypothetical protein